MLLYYYLKSKFFEWREQKWVERNFYHVESFRKKDQALLKTYSKKSPYAISKEHLLAQNEKEIHIYGETPLSTMHKVIQECELSSEDILVEMGAGRGRVALFLAEYLGCQVEAYEKIPFFQTHMIPSKHVKVYPMDMFSADFSRATAIYLFGTLLNTSEIIFLAQRFPKNVKIITISYSLVDYDLNYRVKKQFIGNFPWGKSQVYWNERIH